MPEIMLPWPSTKLSPNARVHWRTRWRANKKYKQDCYWSLMQQQVGFPTGTGKIALEVVFHPPSARRIDADNCIARIKGAFDSLASYWKVDDSRFTLSPSIGEKIKGGGVRIRY